MTGRYIMFLCVTIVCVFLFVSKGFAEIPCLLPDWDGVVTLEMEARPVTLELRPGVYFDAWGYCIKGEHPTVPGPTIKVREGTKIRIRFTNKLAVPASVHPHGVRYTIASDGTHIAGNHASIVEPGEARIFEWDTAGTPGTWYYHSMAFERGGEKGLSKGLWGALLVAPESVDPDPPDKEFVAFMHTYCIDGKEYCSFNDKSGDMEFMLGNSSAFSGEAWKVGNGEKIKIHLINIDEEMHTFHIHGHRWISKPTGKLVDTIGLDPFTTHVLEFVAGEGVGPGNWAFHCQSQNHIRNGMFGIFMVGESKIPKPLLAASASESAPPTLDGKTASFMYTDPLLKSMYEDFVGLAQGDGPWAQVYQPIPLYTYFNPARHYTPPESKEYETLLGKYKPGQCVECHEEVSPGIVAEWKMSDHANTKKTPYQTLETQEIEQLIGKQLNNWKPGTTEGVYCSYCHGDDHENLFMPTVDTACGICHPAEAGEFMRGRDFGKPSHPHSWEGSVSVPWYAELYRRGEGFSMVGCDQCHQNMSSCDDCHSRHRFSAAEARRPEVCSSCHMGPDHPDWESYEHSKWGVIYETTGGQWDWEKKLSQIVPGVDYLAPTCQYCHMYVGGGRWEMNVETKGIWRMGTIPPMEVEFKSGLKDFPYGIKIPPMDKKLEIYSAENRKKREDWIELCVKCHSDRFSRMWLDSLDQYMFASWKRIDEAQFVLENLFADDMIVPSPEDRPPFPLSDAIVKALGPDTLGPELYNLFKKTSGHLPVIGPILGAYSIFTQADGNPSGIEREFVEMWFWDHLQGYKGTAHAQQDISWWWGTAQTGGRMTRIQDEARKLRRLKALEDAIRK
ncbi:MAG: multicopper oxidase domain-containing protein [Candidatus Brocadiaceae bacterium]|nr:multicopper oxidase domain-containing protein [Candidatus Brocadiaceae bacterium]